MAELKSVKYIDASALPKMEQTKLNVTNGLVAIETYNDIIEYKVRILKTGIIDYILDGEPAGE